MKKKPINSIDYVDPREIIIKLLDMVENHMKPQAYDDLLSDLDDEIQNRREVLHDEVLKKKCRSKKSASPEVDFRTVNYPWYKKPKK